ncbi:hypothetical protein C0989_000364 [Termitomyces sp. Mn162]|nr:hypothetical protein C0989_000364 [Termitomyces sp. Mn162]
MAILMPVAMTKQQKTVTSNNGEKETKDVEMREMTPLVMIAEVEPEVSGGEVESKGEVEAEAIEVDEDKVQDAERVC